MEDPYYYEETVVKDLRDGEAYRNNNYFKEHPDATPILMFTDELEAVNPLMSARGIHKLLCMYYTTMDIQPQYRSQIKSVQLVSLFPSRLLK